MSVILKILPLSHRLAVGGAFRYFSWQALAGKRREAAPSAAISSFANFRVFVLIRLQLVFRLNSDHPALRYTFLHFG